MIVATSVVKDEADYNQLVPMVEQVEENTGKLPWITTADSGYHDVDNYKYFKEKGRLALIPDKMYQLEKLGKTRYIPKSAFKYDAGKDVYICPAGNALTFYCNTPYKGEQIRNYYCRPGNCSLKSQCTRAEFRRVSKSPGDDLVRDMRNNIGLETRRKHLQGKDEHGRAGVRQYEKEQTIQRIQSTRPYQNKH